MSPLEKAARALCARHYQDRFGKSVEDKHVQMNVDGNWHLFVEDAHAPHREGAPFPDT